MKYLKLLRLAVSIPILLLAVVSGHTQLTVVKGIVRDATTMKPLSFVSVYFQNHNGAVSDENGRYTLSTNNAALKSISFSYVGYKVVTKTVSAGRQQEIDVDMEELEPAKDVIVSSRKKVKYTNRNNPAVELIREVVAHKRSNRLSAYPYVQYQQYEKMELSLTTSPEKLVNNRLLRNYKFLVENEDTTVLEGKSLRPVYMEEKLSQKYFRNDPQQEKTYLLGTKRVEFGDYIDNDGVSSYLRRMYADINVYDNDISLLSNQFLSPIADAAPTFYMFFIQDTVELDGIKLAKMYFTPRNPNDLLFRGTMFITLDGNYAVQKMNMNISRKANLNWVSQLKVNQEFEKGSDGRYHVSLSNMIAEFAIKRTSTGSIVGARTISYKDFKINEPAPDSVYQGKDLVEAPNPSAQPDSFWVTNRHKPLSSSEAKVYYNMDSLQNMKSYKSLMTWATLLFSGYKAFGGYDVGPIAAFYSFNPVEGFRLRAGGRTNTRFDKNIYLENYVAYGFKDQKWKYFLAATYSFNHKSVYSFPLNYLRVSYQYDTKIPGQELQFVQEDNFLLSFKRGDNNKWLYNNIFKTEYVREFGKHLSYTLGFKNWKQTTAGTIIYQKPVASGYTVIPSVTTSELSAEVRWAPNEQFYQGKVYRTPILNKYPIFKLRYTAGIKGLMKGEYNYHAFNVNIFKRFYLSQLGYADIVAEGGYTFGQVPYPLLNIHRANQTFAYQLNSYNMMNFLEFVSDHFAAFNMDYYLNGFLFNKVPLLKKLKWREVAGVKVLFGGVRDENNPRKNNTVFEFPKNADTGVPTTFSLNKQPYVEASVGIANIFKLIRVDFVRRLTYLDNPDITKYGIRTRLKFDF